MYGLDPTEYDKLLNNNVTKSYKKPNIKTVNEINKEANVLTEKLKINDHKPHFPKNVICRLLNPCKSEIVKISKVYLKNINNSIRSSNNINQWQNSKNFIDWFKIIPLKKQSHFIKFDIVSFCTSISRNVLNEAIQFTRNYHNINDDMINAIMNSRKGFLFYDGNPWVKKDTLQHFDVTEGSFDGAEICETCGFLPPKLVERYYYKWICWCLQR